MTITDEIQDALRALRIAENHFSEATDPEQVEIAAYEYKAAREKYDAAVRRAKAQVA